MFCFVHMLRHTCGWCSCKALNPWRTRGYVVDYEEWKRVVYCSPSCFDGAVVVVVVVVVCWTLGSLHALKWNSAVVRRYDSGVWSCSKSIIIELCILLAMYVSQRLRIAFFVSRANFLTTLRSNLDVTCSCYFWSNLFNGDVTYSYIYLVNYTCSQKHIGKNIVSLAMVNNLFLEFSGDKWVASILDPYFWEEDAHFPCQENPPHSIMSCVWDGVPLELYIALRFKIDFMIPSCDLSITTVVHSMFVQK